MLPWPLVSNAPSAPPPPRLSQDLQLKRDGILVSFDGGALPLPDHPSPAPSNPGRDPIHITALTGSQNQKGTLLLASTEC